MRTMTTFGGRKLGMVLTLAIAAAACSPTYQDRKVEPSGFFEDYSQLERGGKGEALLRWVDEDADWASYDKILLDPVTVWMEDTTLDGMPEDELQVLIDYLDSSVRAVLSRDYELVERPAPGTIRLRVAITEARGAQVILNSISTVIPQLRLLSTAKQITTGTHAFVARAGLEAELEDALTDERLAAVVDRRSGGKRVAGATATWDGVQRAFDHWAEQMRTKLAELRSANR